MHIRRQLIGGSLDFVRCNVSHAYVFMQADSMLWLLMSKQYGCMLKPGLLGQAGLTNWLYCHQGLFYHMLYERTKGFLRSSDSPSAAPKTKR